jgi:hypothetical protein
MEDCDRAQAVELIRALRCQLREMSVHLAWLELRDVTVSNGMNAAALRRDIQETRAHIDRLQRRYLGLRSNVGALTRGRLTTILT